MKPDKTQVEQIQTFLPKEDSSVTFYPKGKTDKDGYWYLTQDNIAEAGKWIEKDDDLEFYEDRTIEEFINFAGGVPDLVAVVNLQGSRWSEEKFESWDHLARYMGLTDLIVLSTKVPKKLAEKFAYYATKDTTVSTQLRKLVFEFVVNSIKENAEKDALR